MEDCCWLVNQNEDGEGGRFGLNGVKLGLLWED